MTPRTPHLRLPRLLATLAAVLLVVCGVVLAPSPASAKKRRFVPPPPPPPPPWYQYAVPFSCGEQTGPPDRAVPGDFAVSVNLLNATDSTARVRKKVLVTYPPGAETPGARSDVIKEWIPGESAVQVSCDEIAHEFVYDEAFPAFAQGFLVIRSNVALEVSVTHTSAGPNGDVATDVEPIVARPIWNRDYVPHEDDGTITICHRPPGNPGNAHSIEIGPSAWPAHAAHGDSKGACPNGQDD